MNRTLATLIASLAIIPLVLVATPAQAVESTACQDAMNNLHRILSEPTPAPANVLFNALAAAIQYCPTNPNGTLKAAYGLVDATLSANLGMASCVPGSRAYAGASTLHMTIVLPGRPDAGPAQFVVDQVYGTGTHHFMNEKETGVATLAGNVEKIDSFGSVADEQGHPYPNGAYSFDMTATNAQFGSIGYRGVTLFTTTDADAEVGCNDRGTLCAAAGYANYHGWFDIYATASFDKCQ